MTSSRLLEGLSQVLPPPPLPNLSADPEEWSWFMGQYVQWVDDFDKVARWARQGMIEEATRRSGFAKGA